MRQPFLAALCAIALAGCTSESADLGTPPPVSLATSSAVVAVSFQSGRTSAASQGRLRQAVYTVAGGELQAVRAQVRPDTAGNGETIRRFLVGVGLDPARLDVEPPSPGRPRSSEVVLTRKRAVTPPCAAAIQFAYPDDPAPSLMSLARCNQANNLANMLVDPADLVAPPALAQQDGAYLAAGVQSWRAGRSGPLPAESPPSGDQGFTAGSSAGTDPAASLPPGGQASGVQAARP
jgi:type IV pilus biogenesis protein CpaD/CtpE